METLHGDTTGLKSGQHKELRALYQRRIPPNQFIHPALARRLTELSRMTGRRLGLLVDRRGTIDKVIVGDAHRVFLPDVGPRRAGADRLRGLRLLLTNFRPEGLTDDERTDLTLLQLDAVLTVHVSNNGLPGTVHWSHLLPPDAEEPLRTERVEHITELNDDFIAFIDDLEAQFGASPALQRTDGAERAILIGVTAGGQEQAKRSLAELERLAQTAGLEIVGTELQRRDAIDGKTFVGKGKLQDLIVRSMQTGAEVLIFDGELAPSQLRNVAQSTELKVLDRTQLILDIFAQRAQSAEGKLQVELAQLRYAMPRLAIMPTAMSRLTGGIGGRGPGETKLEINRRRAQERVTRVELALQKLAGQRAERRKRRVKNEIPQVSIVGYTNAGKSTLLNRLTDSEVDAADQLFATLDPTSRRYRFPEEREIIVTDTVGFIEDLPNTLVQAFRATLEELDGATLLLHLLDASDPHAEHHKRSVEAVLEELKLSETPTLLVWNKADIADPLQLDALRNEYGGLALSATTGEGCERLLDHIERELFAASRANRTGNAKTG